MDLNVNLAGLSLASPIYNASGPLCTSLKELLAIAESSSAAVLSKSCTLQPRSGNPEPRYFEFVGGSINSMGLPNLGYRKYLEIFPQLTKFNKPLIASVSGLSLDDNLKIITAFNDLLIDAMEINLSCPNVVGKAQVGYDFETTELYLQKIKNVIKKPWGVKLPPYFDFVHFKQMAKILNNYQPNYITCINSTGNGLVIDPDKEQVVIKPKNGFGGLGGSIIKPTSLANVKKFRELLKPAIQIVGVGGIATGTDVFEYILAGADVVQVGTAFYHENTPIFSRLIQELIQVMEQKGYNRLDDFRNKLKTIN